MPYKNDDERRAFQRARYEQTGAEKQRRALKRKLEKAYELNEEQRRKGEPLTPMTNITQAHTLAKHGIHVEWDPNAPGVLVRPPRDVEAGENQRPASSPFAELLNKLVDTTEKSDEIKASEKTVKEYWKMFVRLAKELDVPAASLATARPSCHHTVCTCNNLRGR